MNALMAKYEVNSELVELDTQTVKDYLVNGGGNASDQEIAMFINLCKYQGLNPFLREAYLIKYSGNAPASCVVGKDAFTRRAAQIDECKGWQAGGSSHQEKRVSGTGRHDCVARRKAGRRLVHRAAGWMGASIQNGSKFERVQHW